MPKKITIKKLIATLSKPVEYDISIVSLITLLQRFKSAGIELIFMFIEDLY